MQSCVCCSRGVDKQIGAAWPTDSTSAVDPEALNALTWTALSHPRKLPRIGRRLKARMERHILKAEESQAAAGMLIFDGLIGACHTNIHMFDQDFLDVVAALLESRNHRLQMLGANAFSKVSF